MDIMSNPTRKSPAASTVPPSPSHAETPADLTANDADRSPTVLPPLPTAAAASPGPCAPGRVREGGGRPPRRAGSDIEELVLVPAQFFMILEGGDPRLSGRLREMITERIAFHSAVFPYLSLPDQLVH